MPRTRTSHTVGDWLDLSKRITPEVTDGAPFLEHMRVRLKGHLDEIQKLSVERDFHEARRLEATKRIREILDEGRRGATLLRRALKEHHGPTSEELSAFGIQPYRGRKRRSRGAVKDPSEGGAAADPQSSGEPSA